jgi:hypothetical protein
MHSSERLSDERSARRWPTLMSTAGGGAVSHSASLGRCELAKATDLEHRARVICDTFLRYKGLERRVVIVGDVLTTAPRYPVRMNIAASRAFGALRIVASRGEIERDPILMKVVEIAGR